MNYLKMISNKDYTSFDLNCPKIVHIRNRQKLEKMIKRKYRRKLKQQLNYIRYLDEK